jgi:probable HAF family extracellular repeat protein
MLGEFTPTDINNRDEVVGVRWTVTGGRAVLWHDGALTDLGMLPGDQYNTAKAINDRGEVVGWSVGEPGSPKPWRAFSWRLAW